MDKVFKIVWVIGFMGISVNSIAVAVSNSGGYLYNVCVGDDIVTVLGESIYINDYNVGGYGIWKAVASMVHSSTALYVGYNSTPGVIDVFNVDNLELVGSIISTNNSLRRIVLRGDTLYVGYNTGVDRINANSLMVENTFRASINDVITAIASSSTAIYVGYASKPAVVHVLDPNSLRVVGSFTASGHNVVRAIVPTDTGLYVGYGDNVIDVLDSNMNVTASILPRVKTGIIVDMLIHDNYMYVAYEPGAIDRINLSDLSVSNFFTANNPNIITSIASQGDVLFVGYQNNPGVVDAINMNKLGVRTFVAPLGHANVGGMAPLGNALIVGYKARVLDKITPINILDVVDINTMRLIRSIPTIKPSCVVGERGKYVYVSNGFDVSYIKVKISSNNSPVFSMGMPKQVSNQGIVKMLDATGRSVLLAVLMSDSIMVKAYDSNLNNVLEEHVINQRLLDIIPLQDGYVGYNVEGNATTLYYFNKKLKLLRTNTINMRAKLIGAYNDVVVLYDGDLIYMRDSRVVRRIHVNKPPIVYGDSAYVTSNSMTYRLSLDSLEENWIGIINDRLAGAGQL